MNSILTQLRKRSGFTLVELLLMLGILAILSTMSAVAVSQIGRNAQRQKTESDVRTVNQAIAIYLSNGGSLDYLTDPNAVLTKLKTTRSKNEKQRFVGAGTGQMIDAKLVAIPIDADSWKSRATYDPVAKRFTISTNNPGVEFEIDPSLVNSPPPTEWRSSGSLSYSQSTGWVWDYSYAYNTGPNSGPSTFNVNPLVTDTTVPANVVTPPIVVPPVNSGPSGPINPPVVPPIPPALLPTPIFNPAGGAALESKFPLAVSIMNLPDSSSGTAVYQLDGGSWTPYAGPVSVSQNSTLRAQFLTIDSTKFRDGIQANAFYYPVPESLGGTVGAEFHSPTGGSNLVYEITEEGTRFSHGDPIFILDGTPILSGDPNVVSFSSTAFNDIVPGQKFKLGDFYYHNGSTYYDSHATGVSLHIAIELPDRGQTLDFNITMDLVNTPNDPDDPDASADFVRLTNLSQNLPLMINGVPYKIVLEFGATDSFGFSTGNQFHVYEGATGQGELLGTFLPR